MYLISFSKFILNFNYQDSYNNEEMAIQSFFLGKIKQLGI
jgi:hypothetical protein